MLDIKIEKVVSYAVFRLKGRIDGTTSFDLENSFNEITDSGQRIFAIDFSNIEYISSAGLRIILNTQKKLKKIGGELILFKLNSSVTEVFKASGFSQIFKIVDDEEAINFTIPNRNLSKEFEYYESDNIKFEKRNLGNPKGKMFCYGALQKLNNADFSEKDVHELPLSELQFAIGLGTMGANYQDCKNYFGEAVVLEHNFYYYPAAKQAMVDYMIYSQTNSEFKSSMFYCVGFKSKPTFILKFDEQDEFVSLEQISNIARKLTQSNIFGLSIVCVSAGIFGMSLKKVPIVENKPENGSIFEQPNFSEWFDFPVEPAYFNNLIVATGVVVKDKDKLKEKNSSILSTQTSNHIHCCVFEKGLLSKDINEFDKELSRITVEGEVLKVQHLFAKSKFKSGYIAIYELED